MANLLRAKKTIFVLLSLIIALVIASRCKNSKDSAESPYLNTTSKDAKYVGMDKCKSCHAGIYKTFMQTGMGKSWVMATKENIDADFSNATVYDDSSKLYYAAYWQNDSLFIKEYRLLEGKQVHERIEPVEFIVGSGRHTYSFILNNNGYLYEAPISYFTQKQKWDMSPGYEKGNNTRFDRNIETECITCHDGYPDQVAGSINKYKEVKKGVDCERCHGPGSLHVEGILAGNIHDTATSPDYRIVNPRRLTTNQQNSLCMRCHLQGIAVLQKGKSFFDFMPSQELNKTMDVYTPSFSHQSSALVLVSHAERLQLSKCFSVSKKLSCITCHNPHVSVKYTAKEVFNNACKGCHEHKKECTQSVAMRTAKQDDCQSCHMKTNKSIDIPHVALHDHYIRKNINEENEDKGENQFLGLVCNNNDYPTNYSKAKAYLEYYEKSVPNNAILDSAEKYLDVKEQKDEHQNIEIARLAFLRNQFAQVIELTKEINASDIMDAWHAYRIGESYSKLNQYAEAEKYFKQSTVLLPYSLEFRNKLGDCFVNQNKTIDAKKEFEWIIKENPKDFAAYSNLGFIYMQENNYEKAEQYLATAVFLNPNKVQTIINLCVVYYQQNKMLPIPFLLKQALLTEPNNQQAQGMLNEVK
jgi:tetratricopeptide (TPR) repeat protein